LRRLFEKKAATKAEVDGARQAVDKAQIEIESLERRRAALVTAPDRSAAQARLQEAESGAATARIAIGLTQMRSPMTGVLYSFDVKPGAYLNAGDLVGNVGRLNQLRVTVYVDEPELGRVSKGMPVTITWDALPGRQWKGTVERTPTQIVTLGTRQVGEVTCMIDNPDLTLIPGTNVNAEIRSNVVPHAVTIPKEALRRQGNQPGVYKLDTKYIRWQPVTVGVSSVTRIQITHGLAEGDAVALPVEAQLQNNQEVRPLYQ
jgi:HlyD family secretion protein